MFPEPLPQPARRTPLFPVRDEIGLEKSLSCRPEDFPELVPGGSETLLLGLGPHPELLPTLVPGLAQRAVFYVEAPELAAQYGADWRARIPENFVELPTNAAAGRANAARLVLYRPGTRLFPGFFGPLLARIALCRLPAPPAPDPRLVWIPGDSGSLLCVELHEAFAALGLRTRLLGPGDDPRTLVASGECPALVLSINFRGIDALGDVAHFLTAAGAKIAVWCVDNPLHLISGLRGRFWTRLPLFVTDAWFLAPLRRLGAERVFHLPLAARESDLANPPRRPGRRADLDERLVFVGRSAFPGKNSFFAGCRLPEAEWSAAMRLLSRGGRPDFAWWLARLGIGRLWPEKDVRRAGYCAEETGRAWRALCLRRAAADLDGALTIFGDAGWRELLPGGKASLPWPAGAELRGPVDYYSELPDICAGAAACLNCTSQLLPQGLTQRHFDVFAWGGLLLSDATPGLAIFPPELTRPVTFRRPEEIVPLFRRLRAAGSALAGLKEAWRAELARAHTYRHRLAALLEFMGM